MKPIKSIADFCGRNKKEPWFKPVVVIIILSVLALGADCWRKWGDKKEMPEQSQTEQEEDNLLKEIWDDSKLHLAVFLTLSVTLIAVEHSKKRLKQTGGKEER